MTVEDLSILPATAGRPQSLLYRLRTSIRPCSADLPRTRGYHTGGPQSSDSLRDGGGAHPRGSVSSLGNASVTVPELSRHAFHSHSSHSGRSGESPPLDDRACDDRHCRPLCVVSIQKEIVG